MSQQRPSGDGQRLQQWPPPQPSAWPGAPQGFGYPQGAPQGAYEAAAQAYLAQAYAGYGQAEGYDYIAEYGNYWRSRCSSCGEEGHLQRDCPTARKCRSCGEEGHMQKNCPNKKKGLAPDENDTIYVSGLPPSVTEEALAEFFGKIGMLKMTKDKNDKRGGKKPKIHIYMDKDTGAPKGDATLTYEDPASAPAAVKWFNGQQFGGSTIHVQLADKRGESAAAVSGGGGSSYGTHGYSRGSSSAPPLSPPSAPRVSASSGLPSMGSWSELGASQPQQRQQEQPQQHHQHDAGPPAEGSGPPPPRKSMEGDWRCPKPGCGNVNFAFRPQCNRCQTPRPPEDSAPRGGPEPATPDFDNNSVFKKGDWKCPMCGNINWERRAGCNRCEYRKPGTAPEKRTGRGGGFDERQDENDRKRKDSAESDEEYDDLGRKKKHHHKGEGSSASRDRERGKERGRTRGSRSRSPHRSHGREKERKRERDRSRERDRDKH